MYYMKYISLITSSKSEIMMSSRWLLYYQKYPTYLLPLLKSWLRSCRVQILIWKGVHVQFF